jgi:hypothetical protein
MKSLFGTLFTSFLYVIQIVFTQYTAQVLHMTACMHKWQNIAAALFHMLG